MVENKTEQKTGNLGADEKLSLDARGQWLSNGEPITHENTSSAFHRNLHRTEHGFELQLLHERKTVDVEDTLYFVRSIQGDAQTGFEIDLLDGRTLVLNPRSLRYSESRLSCLVPSLHSASLEEARFLNPAYNDLLKQASTDGRGIGIEIKGIRHHLSE